MPNYVTTKLTVTGPNDDVSRFRREILNSLFEEDWIEFDFNQIIPMPPEVKATESDWYSWCVNNWGTKWSAGSPQLILHDGLGGALIISFETAWSFPHPIFDVLVKRFPTLTFTTATFDEGWNFASNGIFNRTITLYDEFIPNEDMQRAKALYEEVYGHPPNQEE